MKNKFLKCLFFVALPPILLLAGVQFYFLSNPAPVPKAPPAASQPPLDLPAAQAQLQTVASSFLSAVKKVSEDLSALTVHHADADLGNFVKSHPGVAGLFQVSALGRIEKMVPPSPPLAGPAYASTDEFKKLQDKLKAGGASSYQFYSQRLAHPSFVFAAPVSQSVMEIVFDLETYFQSLGLPPGDFFLLEPASGRYLYHSNKAKLPETFNHTQEAWLSKVQTDLRGQKAGTSQNSTQSAVYAPLGISSLGIVRVFSNTPPPAPPSLDHVPSVPKASLGLAVLLSLAWVFLVGSLSFGWLSGPLKRTHALLVEASKNNRPLTPEEVGSLGEDEVGQVAKAMSLLWGSLQKEKESFAREKEEALRHAKASTDAAQAQDNALRTELDGKNQLLNDKLKELDAMRSMTEGLRNQGDRMKEENAKLRGQLSSLEQAQAEGGKKLAESQARLRELEVKLSQAAASSSGLQPSKARVAAIKTMAEELKTALGIIKGYVSSSLGSGAGAINEKQQEFLGMVINRSARLEKFINDFVDVHQVEIEKKDAPLEEIQMASEIEGLAFNFQAQAEVKNLKIKVEAKPDLPKVPVVRKRFNQVWNFLLLQAIKDAPRAAAVEIFVEAVGDNVLVSLHDPGLAVSPEILSNLFDEFYDPQYPASPQLAGTGLKFALVKAVMNAHGGGVTAEKTDPGVKITLSFPAKTVKGSAPSTETPPPAAPSKPLVAGTLDALLEKKPAAPGGAPVAAPPSPAPAEKASPKPALSAGLEALLTPKPASTPNPQTPPAASSAPAAPKIIPTSLKPPASSSKTNQAPPAPPQAPPPPIGKPIVKDLDKDSSQGDSIE